ncbi:MAG: PAS domain S-box protein, partial [Candidatus Thermoplasmatota archaeon]|nr:PAS domain S-box protein [Candidatus Thermoplasmatota archaeon]
MKQKLSRLLLGQKGGENRVQIIEMLRTRPYNLNQLAESLGLNYRTIKHHMDVMLENQIVTSSNSGGYGEVFFISGEMERNIEIYENIRRNTDSITSSPDFYKKAVDNTSDAMILLDDSGDVVFWNYGAERIFGYSEEEVLGSRLDIFQNDEFLRRFFENLDDVEDIIGVEKEGKTKEGRELVLRVTLSTMVDGQEKPLGASLIASDMTDLSNMIRSLAKEKNQMTRILEGMHSLVYVSDMEDYKIIYSNPAIKRAWGKDLVGSTCYEVLANRTSPCEYCKKEELRENGGEPISWEYQNPILKRHYLALDNLIHWTNDRDVKLQIATDITELADTKKQVVEEKKKLERILESTKAMMA